MQNQYRINKCKFNAKFNQCKIIRKSMQNPFKNNTKSIPKSMMWMMMEDGWWMMEDGGWRMDNG